MLFSDNTLWDFCSFLGFLMWFCPTEWRVCYVCRNLARGNVTGGPKMEVGLIRAVWVVVLWGFDIRYMNFVINYVIRLIFITVRLLFLGWEFGLNASFYSWLIDFISSFLLIEIGCRTRWCVYVLMLACFLFFLPLIGSSLLFFFCFSFVFLCS